MKTYPGKGARRPRDPLNRQPDAEVSPIMGMCDCPELASKVSQPIAGTDATWLRGTEYAAGPDGICVVCGEEIREEGTP